MLRRSDERSAACLAASATKESSNSLVNRSSSTALLPTATESDARNAMMRARAATLAFSTDLALRLPNSAAMAECNALNTMAKPSTSAMSSSSASWLSCAACSSSCAMPKLTDTDKSEPIPLKVPNVVPPMPPVAAPVPPAVVGLPLILKENYDEALTVSRSACRAAARDGCRMLIGFFAYQHGKELITRLLYLTSAQARGVQKQQAKRRKTSNGLAAHQRELQGGSSDEDDQDDHDHTAAATAGAGDSVQFCGLACGTSLGNIVFYLEGRGVPAERAHILRSIRARLLPCAEALKSMRGADADQLMLGMASCRIVAPQRLAMPELARRRGASGASGGAGVCGRFDAKYGNVATAVGVTAALLVAFAIMAADVPAHCNHFVKDCSFGKALRCAEAQLLNWRSTAAQTRAALSAEARALQRASLAVCEAIAFSNERKLAPAMAMAIQLRWARRAAFPDGELVDEFTHARLCERIRSRQLFELPEVHTAPPTSGPALASPVPLAMARQSQQHQGAGAAAALLTSRPGIVPLAQIPESLLVTPASMRHGTLSSGSSSWQSLPSSNSSQFSRVSADSLDELNEGLVLHGGIKIKK